MNRQPDWTLYLVAYPPACRGRDVVAVAEAAVRGGVTLVQLRMKECTTRSYLETSKRLRQTLADHGVPLLINDRVDVAMAAGADGVHLGQTDMPADLARELMGEQSLIGLSADTQAQAAAAEGLPVDYVGVGPVFPTATKADTGPTLGVEGLRQWRRRCHLPLIGIGGVTAENAAQIVRSGADGIAVVSAICGASDPARAACELRQAIEAARSREGDAV